MMLLRRAFIAWAVALAAGCSTEVPLNQVEPPPPPQVPLRRIAFVSCIDQTQEKQALLDSVTADRPDLVLFTGDTVYANEQPFSVEKLRAAYAQEAANPSFARLRRSVPAMQIWDDGEYGMNDGGAEFAGKFEAKQAFLDFWQVAEGDPRRQREGLYYSEMYGPPGQRVQVIVFETRWFRSPWKRTDVRDAPGKERYVPDADPAKTMLGDAQWQWLEQELRKPADVRLLVSGIQVIVEGHGWERWGNFPLERAKLFKLIGSTKANGVVFVSGDRHIGALYRETKDAPYPMYEITSSGVTHPWTTASEAGPNRLGDLYTAKHYGTVEIDWRTRSLQLHIKDELNTTRRVQRIAFDELQVKP